MMLNTNSKSTKKSQKAPEMTSDKGKGRAIFVLSTLFVVIAVILFFGGRFCWRNFYLENPELNIQEIIITETKNFSGPKTNGKTSVHTILSEMGIETNVNNNIIQLDIRQIRERLEQEPILKNIEVRKIMPKTLSISFEERIPVAIIQCPRKPCYIDKDAVILPTRRASDDSPYQFDAVGLPVITAVQNPDTLINGQPTTDKFINASIELIAKIKTHPKNIFFKIKQIQISLNEELLIATVSPMMTSNIFAEDCSIIFPILDMDKAIERLFYIAENYEKPQPITRLDVSYKTNITLENAPSVQ